MNWLKKYWVELLIFGVIFAILIIDLNPDYTFMNKAADSIGYTYSAKYLYPSYHTSPPLYLLLGHIFLKLPFGTDAWRMGLISVLSTMGACLFIYLIIRKLIPTKRIYAILGVLIYGMSALVISQSIIVNTYALVCLLAVGAYYFAITKRWNLMALMLGIGLAVHLLSFVVLLVMFIFYKEYRKNWRALAITASFILFYLYIPLTNRPPYMWLPNPSEVNSVKASIDDTVSVILMLVGGISIWDVPKRILDTLCIVGLSVGVITIVPIVYYFKRNRKGILRSSLFWLTIFPIALFISELDMNTFDYTMVAIPFLAIMACLGLNMMVERFGSKAQRLGAVILLVILGLGIFNASYFDLGRTLDPQLSASKLYYTEFAKIPDGAVFMPNYAWEWEAIFKYNKDYNKHIYPICIDVLPSDLYRKQLRTDGIKLVDSDDSNVSVASKEMAESIVALNDNVWLTISISPRTFGSEVIPANHNTSLIPKLDESIMQKNAANPDWQWKPYNPYDILTTSIFISDWHDVILSNYNLRFFVSLASIGLILNWLIFILPRKKTKVAEE